MNRKGKIEKLNDGSGVIRRSEPPIEVAGAPQARLSLTYRRIDPVRGDLELRHVARLAARRCVADQLLGASLEALGNLQEDRNSRNHLLGFDLVNRARRNMAACCQPVAGSIRRHFDRSEHDALSALYFGKAPSLGLRESREGREERHSVVWPIDGRCLKSPRLGRTRHTETNESSLKSVESIG